MTQLDLPIQKIIYGGSGPLFQADKQTLDVISCPILHLFAAQCLPFYLGHLSFVYFFIDNPTKSMELTFRRVFMVVLVVFYSLPQSLCVWVTYKQFVGFIPSYTYKFTLNAGDTIRGYLTWPGTQDLDIYLYRSGQDLLSMSTYVTRQFSATANPQDLIYTVTTAGVYYLRVDLYSSIPTPYKFQVYINGQPYQTYYDTVISLTTGITVQQITVDGPCKIQVKYDGPIYNLYLYAPGVDVVYGTPVASNNSMVNPKYLASNINLAGKWNLVIDHQLYSSTTQVPFTITVETEVGALQCINSCSNISYNQGPTPGSATDCLCLTGFTWNSATRTCSIVCSSFNTTSDVGTAVSGTIDQCRCLNSNQVWNTTQLACIINCSLVTSSTGVSDVNGSCVCPTGFMWNASSLICVRNCTAVLNATTLSTTNTSQCNCQTNYNWNSTQATCNPNLICGDGFIAGSQQCDDGNNVDGDGCNADCTIGNNNSCPASSPYINPSTGNCTASCPSGFYPNTTTFSCPACYYTCGTCTNATDCVTCSASSNRYLNGTQCLPSSGFFDNTTQVAPACISPCVTCTSATVCSTCITGYYLSAAMTCVACSTSIMNCTQCNSSTVCTACQAGYALNATTLACDLIPCTVANCSTCPVSLSNCTSCITGYQLTGGLCVTVCGDNITAGTQQCDDGNNIDGDGCYADCTIGNNNGCPVLSPYTNTLTGNCTATCPSGYYPNTTTFLCQVCYYTCGTCTNATDCVTCSSASHRYLNGTQCLPLPGFYDNNTLIAPVCVSPCAQCSSSSSCTTCVVGFYLSGSTCQSCSTVTANCTRCNSSTVCTSCQVGYILNATTLACDVVPCYDPNCLACPNSMAVCTQCTFGLQPVNGVCQTVCGDFIMAGTEACDDGNTKDKDGCSSACSVEKDFTCESDIVHTAGSACFYIGDVTIKEVYINKVDGQNKVEILLDLFPSDLPIWDNVNFMDMMQIQSPVPLTGYTITRNPDGKVSITLDYAADIHNQPIDIRIDPAKTNIPIFSRTTPTTTNLVITPDDNEGAYFYDDSTYKMAGIISTLCMAISAMSLLFFLIGLISGKMVGVEMMAVVQISFFSLVTLSQLNPCFAALSSLKLVNGYNSLNHNHLEDELTPINPKGIFLFSRFTENFNFTVAIIVIPLLVALIAFILSKTALKENEKTVRVAQKAVGQYTLMGLLFGGYLTAVSFALELMYGMKNSNDLIGKVSLAECAILLSMMVGYFVFLILKPEFFGEFTEEFKKDLVSSKYYNYMIVERVLVGSCLVFLLTANIGAVVPLCVFVASGIFVVVKKPYRSNYHNYRVVANMSIAAAVEGVYLAYTLTPAENRNTSIFFYLPFIVCALLIICVLYNAAAIIYGIYKMCKNSYVKESMEKEELEQMNKLRKETIFQSTPTSPSAVKQSLSIPTPFKEDTVDPSLVRKKLKLAQVKNEMKMDMMPKTPKSPTKSYLLTDEFNLEMLDQFDEYDGI